MQTEKRCAVCGVTKLAAEFHVVTDKRYARRYLQGRCKGCSRAYMRQWSRTPSGRAFKKNASRTQNLASYGMNEDGYRLLLESQHGDSTGRRLSVDHDHDTDEVRGVLCHSCNVVLGLVKEDVEVLRKAILYLSRETKTVPVLTFSRN